jgi:preprotein translocase subunit YajC
MVEFVNILAVAEGAAQGSGLEFTGVMVIAMIAMLYLMYRNQKKEAKKRQTMLSTITKGTKVITVGGIHGEIAEVKEDTFLVQIADKVIIEIAKTGVSAPEQTEEFNAKDEETKGK